MEENKIKLEGKVLAFYAKLGVDCTTKGPVYRMVMNDVMKEYREYFGIKFITSVKIE